jgi:hypothetical protein
VVNGIKARQLAFNEAQNALNDTMGAWNDANPFPKQRCKPDMLKPLHKIPCKVRTPEILAQIKAARAEKTRLQNQMLKSVRTWYEAREVEIAHLKATFSEQIQHDSKACPSTTISHSTPQLSTPNHDETLHSCAW